MLDFYRLSRDGWANAYYSAAVRSMLHSGHNFVFAAFDPTGFVSVDKPPLALWVQAGSARLFGYSSLAILAPEALAGVLSVWLLYATLAPHVGRVAATCAAAVLATWPALVAVDRDNNPDALMIFLMLASAWAARRAISTGRMRWLLATATLAGLAFNTKGFAGWAMLPGIGVALWFGYRRRDGRGRPCRDLALAFVALVLISGLWIAIVEFTPAAQRPYVGSTSDNSELSLTFGYNGLDRLDASAGAGSLIGSASGPQLGGHPAVTRLFNQSFGPQGGWWLPLALLGAAVSLVRIRALRGDSRVLVLVYGAWFFVEYTTLSFASGTLHPYYVAAAGPAAAAMIGVGLRTTLDLPLGSELRLSLLLSAMAITLLAQTMLLREAPAGLGWLADVLLPTAALCTAGAALATLGVGRLPGLARRVLRAAPVAAIGVCLFTPAAYAATLWRGPIDGIYPAAGAHGPRAEGSAASPPVPGVRDVSALVAYLRKNAPRGGRYLLATASAFVAAPLIIETGAAVVPLGGFTGNDPILSPPALARLVGRGHLHYFLVPGPEAGVALGNSPLTNAVTRTCAQISASEWGGTVPALYDCAARGGMLIPGRG